MSQETYEWLNTQVLVGFTSKRGNAWHYLESEQGVESNHYEGAVPVEDVRRRLFSWEPIEGTFETTYFVDNAPYHILDESRKAIIRPVGALSDNDEGAVLGSFKSGFQIHPYKEWLITHVQTLLDNSDIQIGSAGLLMGGARAWVQVEMEENYEVQTSTGQDVTIRPFLAGATSVDGTLSSTYLRGAKLIVCDNTLAGALGDKNALRVKIKHSKNSLGRIDDVRRALEVVQHWDAMAEDFMAEIEALSEIKVTPKQWSKFLNIAAPVEGKEKRALTMAENKQDKLTELWKADPRVAPWAGTAWGVVQAMNTYNQHEAIVRGTVRPERNMLNFLAGKVEESDNQTLSMLNKVVALAK